MRRCCSSTWAEHEHGVVFEGERGKLAFDALIACSRAHLDADALSRIERLPREAVDWTRVVGLAAIHGTRPTLYRTLTVALLKRLGGFI